MWKHRNPPATRRLGNNSPYQRNDVSFYPLLKSWSINKKCIWRIYNRTKSTRSQPLRTNTLVRWGVIIDNAEHFLRGKKHFWIQAPFVFRKLQGTNALTLWNSETRGPGHGFVNLYVHNIFPCPFQFSSEVVVHISVRCNRHVRLINNSPTFSIGCFCTYSFWI
jgi:hypothetical protein